MTTCGGYTKAVVLALITVFLFLFFAIWIKRRFFAVNPAMAFIFPARYRVVSNFTLMLAKLRVVGGGNLAAMNWETENLNINFDRSTSLLNATGTDLNYFDYSKNPPMWSSRTMYDPLTSSKLPGLSFLHDGTGTTDVGDYYYYSVINGTYSCSKFDYEVPPRDLFILEGKLITSQEMNGELCYVWRAPYKDGLIEQWVSARTSRPKRQVMSLKYPVGHDVEAQALLISDFLELNEMKEIPFYVFTPPFTCISPP